MWKSGDGGEQWYDITNALVLLWMVLISGFSSPSPSVNRELLMKALSMVACGEEEHGMS